MPGLITMGIVILYLMSLFYPPGAMGLTVAKKAIQKGASSKAATKSSSKAKPNIVVQAVPRDVINIVVDRIDGALIYSKDWRTFEVPSTTKVIDNRHRVTKMRTAELVFENGRLVAVTLK